MRPLATATCKLKALFREHLGQLLGFTACCCLQYLVLGWGAAQRDLEVIIKVVGQLCSSARSEGGTTIVVLTQREKLAMEEMFRWGPDTACLTAGPECVNRVGRCRE